VVWLFIKRFSTARNPGSKEITVPLNNPSFLGPRQKSAVLGEISSFIKDYMERRQQAKSDCPCRQARNSKGFSHAV
jgi:hypothetical protein